MTPPKSPPQPAVSVEQARVFRIALWNTLRGRGMADQVCYDIINPTMDALPASAAPPADGVPAERERWESCNCPEAPFDDEVVYDSNLSPRCPRCNVALGGDPMTDSARAAIRAEEALEAAAPKAPTAPIGEAGEGAHWSDCAVHNNPPEPCDCGGLDKRSWQAGFDAALSHVESEETRQNIRTLLSQNGGMRV